MSGDAYIFLLGDSLDDWFAARRTFIKVRSLLEIVFRLAALALFRVRSPLFGGVGMGGAVLFLCPVSLLCATQLAGPTPLLPDYAYGTWFTYWHQYTEAEAKGEVERWQSDQLPLDIWALDMVRKGRGIAPYHATLLCARPRLADASYSPPCVTNLAHPCVTNVDF